MPCSSVCNSVCSSVCNYVCNSVSIFFVVGIDIPWSFYFFLGLDMPWGVFLVVPLFAVNPIVIVLHSWYFLSSGGNLDPFKSWLVDGSSGKYC